MFQDKSFIIVTPAGRRRYMEVLEKYIEKIPYLDEWQIWVNTKDVKDRQYLSDLSIRNSKVKLILENENGSTYGQSTNLCNFWKYAAQPNTIYLRLDDDIVYIETDALVKFLEHRLNSTNAALLYPLIINNVGISYILQQKGIVPKTKPMIGEVIPTEYPELHRGGYHPLDCVGWQNANYAAWLHINLLNILRSSDCKYILPQIKFDSKVLMNYEHVSINACCWLGESVAKILQGGTQIPEDEERFMTSEFPKLLNCYNEVYGNMIVSHFAFYIQRAYLDSTHLLDNYAYIAGVEKQYKSIIGTGITCLK